MNALDFWTSLFRLHSTLLTRCYALLWSVPLIMIVLCSMQVHYVKMMNHLETHIAISLTVSAKTAMQGIVRNHISFLSVCQFNSTTYWAGLCRNLGAETLELVIFLHILGAELV